MSEDDGEVEADEADRTHMSVHISLSGDLNPSRLEDVATQTTDEAPTERTLYIGPPTADASTQVRARKSTTEASTQTETTLQDIMIVAGPGAVVRLN